MARLVKFAAATLLYIAGNFVMMRLLRQVGMSTAFSLTNVLQLVVLSFVGILVFNERVGLQQGAGIVLRHHRGDPHQLRAASSAIETSSGPGGPTGGLRPAGARPTELSGSVLFVPAFWPTGSALAGSLAKWGGSFTLPRTSCPSCCRRQKTLSFIRPAWHP